jgi:protein TonB
MFDLVSGQVRHVPRHQGLPLVISSIAQALIVGLVFVVPYLYVTESIPEVATILTFVAAPAPPPPPPPAPPATAAPSQPKPAQARPRPRPVPQPAAAPVNAPRIVATEPIPAAEDENFVVGDEEGVFGGVEGGVAGGVLGGIVGGIPDVPPPPPPPPPRQAAREPVRVGGQIKTPALVTRVDPEYPALAMAAKYQGMVILEAEVGEDGHVDDVRVLRSGGFAGILDRAALTAVRQWVYSPLLLNGRAERFVLTVTLSFTLADAS